MKIADLQAHNAARYELVDLLFSLVWVPGKRLISLLGHGLKRLVTTGLKATRAYGQSYTLQLIISPIDLKCKVFHV